MKTPTLFNTQFVIILESLPGAKFNMLKITIIFLFIGILISLGCGFVFFYQDKGKSKRTLYALGVRVTFAVLLILCVIFGLFTGELSLQAPWL